MSRIALCAALLAATLGAAAARADPAATSPAPEGRIELAQAGYDPMAQPFDPMRPSARPAPEPEVRRNPEFGNLPEAPGMEETYYLCSACHSIELVKQQRLSDARWDYLWTWMIEEQGMPEQDAETRELILSYLKQYFSSER